MIIFQLDEKDKSFPDPLLISDEQREPNGLFAIGGDLSSERLIEAYSLGIFPWSDYRRAVLHWYCPIDRFVIFPNEVHISHSMRTLLNQNKYSVTIDTCFENVIGRCSEKRIRIPGAWLGPQMVEAYTELHKIGIAHSVEVWDTSNQLVGGLYGIEINNCFFGESMFSDVPNGSKIALVYFSKIFESKRGRMIDCQFETPHLLSMGGRHISYSEYMSILWPSGKRKISIDD